ncbi:hypothetical protein PVAND_007648 [Polypedilum vanderplanki]|uniref:SAC3/GANP/THP3 conserved domain-containing protein n=1 Tax=Polypedilum vanderplanki TaxID=319348 RepID=A0A9J6C8G2_POLVA|nr:hypothetical protein PVAND_007648 [Polypedilum vanderplanki]
MFLSYSLYQLNGLSISLFDRKICQQHLQECLQKCLTCYEEIDATEDGNYKIQNRIVIEAVYLLFNINDFNALQHTLKLDSKLKSSFTLKTAINIAISFHQKNFHKLLHDIQNLPHLVGAIGSLNLSSIRKEVFRIFSIAYNSQSLKVPLEFLQRLLIYDEMSSLIRHIYDLGIYKKEDGGNEITAVVFNRKNFDCSKTISNTSQHFVDQKLCDFHLPDLILMKTI